MLQLRNAAAGSSSTACNAAAVSCQGSHRHSHTAGHYREKPTQGVTKGFRDLAVILRSSNSKEGVNK
jgi:hypothetical protein